MLKSKILRAVCLLLSMALLLSFSATSVSAEQASAASVGNTAYSTVAQAVANANGQPVKLLADSQEQISVNGDLYLDLNGHTLAGLTVTNGTLYGMDSTTDDYSCAEGYGKILSLNGQYAPHLKTDITGSIRRYLAVKEDGAVSFHRYYLGLVYASIRSSSKGVGYKAVFAGDSVVQQNLDATEAFGYELCLDGHDPISLWKPLSQFESLKNVTMLIQNFDAAQHGETGVSATVQLKFADGTLISTSPYTTNLKSVVETVNDTYTSYTQGQLSLLADWIKEVPHMLRWRVENIVPKGPMIIVSEITAKAGETVDVPVVISGNPGVAGAKFTISYDEGLILTGATSGEAFSYLQYTKPGKFISPCNFTWDSESGEATDNGTVLTLHFSLPANAAAGETFQIGCTYKLGDMYDEDLNDLEFTTLGGKVTVAAEGITVTFKDHDGTVLSTQQVEPGQAAIAPPAPSRDGYIFTGWDEDFSNITEPTTVTAQYQQLTGATIMVSNVTAQAGQTVDVPVLIVNNPGVAGAKFTISFDEGLILTGATSGDAFSYLQYTKPGKFISPCNFTWDSESGEASDNGTVLTLHFTVPATAAAGDTFQIGCTYKLGDMYDEDLNDLEFTTMGGTITVE